MLGGIYGGAFTPVTVASALVGMLFLVALLSPVIAPHDPLATSPDNSYLMGKSYLLSDCNGNTTGGQLVGSNGLLAQMIPEASTLCLLTGAVDVVLDEADGERVVELTAGQTCIVPRGVWHRAIVREPGDTLHITRGAGTQHRPR